MVVAQAQDTLLLNMRQTDSLFLSNNLILLSQKFKIDADKALIKQAKLWDNPTLNTEWNLYNGVKHKFFDVGSTGQKAIAIEQVISIAGKRNKRIELAKTNAQFSEFEFYDLMRTLKLELRKNFYIVYFNARTIEKYSEQLSFLSTIIDALQLQSDKGNIPLKEVLRLKAEFYQLNNDLTDLMMEMFDAQQALQTLLQTTIYIKPQINDERLALYNIEVLNDKNKLLNAAINNRSDVKMAQNLLQQSELNYKLQKRLNYPDLRIGGSYDQAGSYINNYTAITLGLDLPVWNRNQGNIKYAKAMSESMKLQLQNKTIEINNEVLSAINKLQQVEKEYQRVDKDFGQSFKMLNDGFITNFQKRNISLIEFIDFFESYNQSILQINKMNEKRIRTYEELNYITGEELYK